MEKIGLLAGVGRLPVLCARAAQALGIEVSAVALLPGVDEELAAAAADCRAINIAQLGKIIDYLKERGVTKVTLLGKVTKELLFAGTHEQPDLRMMQLLMTLPDKKDDTIMLAFVRELAKEGMEAFDQTVLLKTLMPPAGTLTKREPTEAERADMEMALAMAKEIGRLDVGQTAVVKNKAVMALEAIEGTDACIRRGGELSGGGAVIGKAAKPQQDMRFDVPTVGPDTIDSMLAAGAKALALEAGRVLVVDRERVVAMAEENGITIAAI
ncbi:UDP-2,3-diacylglucosamine diphosphatase LpxI [Selenomonas sputigena]|uniref:UDP-2,3-diacylglucosamine diphosphatase LpxI n=1 Tax=Selenomonas sputigena TaxID=69823 RepID=A0ABV3X5L9_9FIRM